MVTMMIIVVMMVISLMMIMMVISLMVITLIVRSKLGFGPDDQIFQVVELRKGKLKEAFGWLILMRTKREGDFSLRFLFVDTKMDNIYVAFKIVIFCVLGGATISQERKVSR